MKTKRVSKSVKSNSRKVRANETQEKKSPKQLAFEKIARHVRDESFWEKGEQALKLLEPIIKKLGRMEADGTCISMVYLTFTELLKKPMYREPTFLVDTATAIRVLVKSRWDKMHTDAMGIAFFLDPSQDPDGFVGDDGIDIKNQIRKVTKRLGFSKAE
ncbi:hypothetical protein DVH05_003587 [Phytophthora capsici]|nr:hypothetical protein DVH05_003587 [Phytophthora capsici]